MLACLDFVRQMTAEAVAIRMVMAVLCGGLIGIEREFKRRPAGFRTHILICLGAATTVLTNLYMYQVMGLYTDIGRLGAQVIAGIGFIGAGTIIVTKRQRVKGLTTAAGLWTAAIIGLVCGAGYIECAAFATLMVLVAELLLVKIEYRFARVVRDVNLYIEYAHSDCIQSIIRIMKEQRVKMQSLEITRISGENDSHYYCAVINIQMNKKTLELESNIVKSIAALEDVIDIEEL